MTLPGDRRPAGNPSRGWTVRQLLALVLVTSVAAMLVVGAIGSLAVHESTETVDTLSQQVGPAQISNAQFMVAMLDSETELRAYLISGEHQQLTDHQAALARLPPIEGVLRRFAVQHHQLAGLVKQQQERAEAWVDDFATRAVAEGPSSANSDHALFDLGVARFDAIKAVNQQISKRLAGQVQKAKDDSQTRLDDTVALIALIGVLGALSCGLVGWWAMRTIRRPLTALEDVVEHLAAGELDPRAAEEGPIEIRRLARAVNTLAEENARSRAMEQEVTDRLLEADRVKSEFVSNVSHELRTPLTSIDGYLELLSDDLFDDLDQDHAEMMTVMQRNVVRLRTLIEDLLDLGRLERRPDELESVDLSRVVRTVAEDLRLSAGSRDVAIVVDVLHSSAMLRADPAQVQRALTNLLSNAVKFSHDGGQVRVRLDIVDDQVVVTVADDGIGIPEADQQKLGERFYRATNAVEAHIPGTGLGLRMVQSIVSNHHGTFGLASQEGVGTTATVRLPLEPRTGARSARRPAISDAVPEAIAGLDREASHPASPEGHPQPYPESYPGSAPGARETPE